MKKIFLFLFSLLISANCFAHVICPQTLHCKNQQCEGWPYKDPLFSNINFPSPIPDGTYYFSESWGGTIAQCSYRDKDGHTWATLSTSENLKVAIKDPSSKWVDEGQNRFWCQPSTAAPYTDGSSYECPFKRYGEEG